MENIYTIKESQLYSTLLVQTVPQNTLNKISNWSLFTLIISDQGLTSLKLIFA